MTEKLKKEDQKSTKNPDALDLVPRPMPGISTDIPDGQNGVADNEDDDIAGGVPKTYSIID